MNDASFIVGLMKTETDALGFIPSTSIQEDWIAKGRYIIQLDRRGRRRGYLLHGPAKPGKPLYVNQVCMEFDHRLKGFATLAIAELVRRAQAREASEIRLRCAADLTANAFWIASGFLPVEILPGGLRRRRRIIQYCLNLHPKTGSRYAPPVPTEIGPYLNRVKALETHSRASHAIDAGVFAPFLGLNTF